MHCDLMIVSTWIKLVFCIVGCLALRTITFKVRWLEKALGNWEKTRRGKARSLWSRTMTMNHLSNRVRCQDTSPSVGLHFLRTINKMSFHGPRFNALCKCIHGSHSLHNERHGIRIFAMNFMMPWPLGRSIHRDN